MTRAFAFLSLLVSAVGLDAQSFVLTEFQKLAMKGDAQAQCSLGICHVHGVGVLPDHEVAARWFRKGAEQGDVRSQYCLGRMIECGMGVKRDQEEAVKWFLKAAEKGHAGACSRLGAFYRRGPRSAEALRFYTKAAELGGRAEDLRVVADMHRGGEGTNRSLVEAEKWLLRAAEKGDAGSQYSLATLRNGTASYGALPIDHDDAAKWFRKAAEQEDHRAQFCLGLAYVRGQGVAKDEAEALKWITKAAHGGVDQAQCSLAGYHERGELGLTMDDVESLAWYRLAGDSHPGYAERYAGGVIKRQTDKIMGRLKPDEKLRAQARYSELKSAIKEDLVERMKNRELQSKRRTFFELEDGVTSEVLR